MKTLLDLCFILHIDDDQVADGPKDFRLIHSMSEFIGKVIIAGGSGFLGQN